MGVLSIILLVLLVLGMPIFSFFFIRKRMQSSAFFRTDQTGHVIGKLSHANVASESHLRNGRNPP